MDAALERVAQAVVSIVVVVAIPGQIVQIQDLMGCTGTKRKRQCIG
jgi:hypothetical protein